MKRMLRSLAAIATICLSLVGFEGSLQAQESFSSPIVGHLNQSGLWAEYKARFIKEDGRIIDNANQDISHSEGQGYGMLLALAASDRTTFAEVYGFAKRKLQIRNDNLFAWKHLAAGDNRIPDLNNATDGDILIAWALLEAAEAGWGETYRMNALSILDDVYPLLVSNPNLGLLITPGTQGFNDEAKNLVINPSYWVFPALERLGEITGDIRWTRLTGSGHYLVEQLAARSKMGIPDWAMVAPLATNAVLHPKKSSLFGYEAIRIPLYLMMAEQSPNELAYTIVDGVRLSNNSGLSRVDTKDGSKKGEFASPGYLAIMNLADCLSNNQRFPSGQTTRLDELYYPATMQLFAVMVATREADTCL